MRNVQRVLEDFLINIGKLPPLSVDFDDLTYRSVDGRLRSIEAVAERLKYEARLNRRYIRWVIVTYLVVVVIGWLNVARGANIKTLDIVLVFGLVIFVVVVAQLRPHFAEKSVCETLASVLPRMEKDAAVAFIEALYADCKSRKSKWEELLADPPEPQSEAPPESPPPPKTGAG